MEIAQYASDFVKNGTWKSYVSDYHEGEYNEVSSKGNYDRPYYDGGVQNGWYVYATVTFDVTMPSETTRFVYKIEWECFWSEDSEKYYYVMPESTEISREIIDSTNPDVPDTPDEPDLPTLGEANALKSAKQYVALMAFSYSGLIEQLEFDGYSASECRYGADNCGADWNKEAAESAQNYMDLIPMSKSELHDQLEFEGFTQSQIAYGLKAVGY